MSDETIKIVARITARPETAAELEAILRGLLAPVRSEPGCISYRLFHNKADPTDFTFVEEWASDAAIEAHFVTAHLRDALAKATKLFGQPPDIRKYSELG